MRRGLLALLVLLGSSSVAFAQGRQLITQSGTAPATTRLGADEVVARIMTFDQNSDGRVAVGELSERMRPMVARGDTNGDGALDLSEVRALAVAPLAAPPQQGRVLVGQGGYSFGDDAGLSSRTHVEGALEDLRLASDKKERALPILRAYVGMVEHAAKEDLISQMEPLLSPQQFTAFTTALNADQRRQVTFRTNTGNIQMLITSPGSDVARRVEAMKLAAPNSEQANKAIEEFKTRIRLGTEADRTMVLAQLKNVLDEEELDNFRAALERRPVVASAVSIVASNAVPARDIIGVVRPAVLIEQAFPANNGVTVR